MSVAPRDRWIAVILALAAFALYLPLFADALGLTYDEPVYAVVGERHLSWFGRLAHGDFGALTPAGLERHWGNSGSTPVQADWHPPVGKLWHAVWRRLPLPGGAFGRWRTGATLLFALTAALLYLWLAPERGRATGVAAALCWLTLPQAIAHGNLAALDGAVTAFATLAWVAGWRLLVAPSAGRAVGYGLALALAAGTKLNGALVAPALLTAMLLQRRAAWRPVLLATFAIAPVAFVACWPWLWYDGWTHLRQLLDFHGRHFYVNALYFGRVYSDPPPPWHYPFVTLALTTPVTVLLTAATGCRRRVTEPTGAPWGQASLPGYLALALVWQILPFTLPAAAKYGGIRLFLPALAPLAALSGLGVGELVVWARRLPPLAQRRWFAPAAVALACYLPGLVGALRVYPYPMAYYGLLAGGTQGAARLGMEVTYWGDPFRGCAAWLSRNAPPGAEVYLNPPGAIAMVEMYKELGLLREDLRLVSGPDAVGRASYYCYQNWPAEWDDLGHRLLAGRPPLHVELADQVPVAFVWRGPGLSGANLPAP